MRGVPERGAVTRFGYQDLDGASSRFVRTEAEGPMDVDPVYPEEAFGNPQGIDPTNSFAPYAQGGLVAVLPTTTPSRPISAPIGDSGSQIGSFLSRSV